MDILDWEPNATTIDKLIKEMVDSDMRLVKNIGGTFQDFDEKTINEIPHFKE